MSSTPLDPFVSEFETEEQEAEYIAWLRAKVDASLADPRPMIPHDQVMAEMDAIIDAAEARQRANVTA
ncbi:MAG: antitoxin [Lautropia sp.]|nr:antitoxin [Lautropia sp.]